MLRCGPPTAAVAGRSACSSEGISEKCWSAHHSRTDEVLLARLDDIDEELTEEDIKEETTVGSLRDKASKLTRAKK